MLCLHATRTFVLLTLLNLDVPKDSLSGLALVAFSGSKGANRRLLMKYHVPYLASVLASIALEQARANAPGGANWFLRAPDGSSQGPYGLSQLGEWSSSGYVSLGESLVTANNMNGGLKFAIFAGRVAAHVLACERYNTSDPIPRRCFEHRSCASCMPLIRVHRVLIAAVACISLEQIIVR